MPIGCLESVSILFHILFQTYREVYSRVSADRGRLLVSQHDIRTDIAGPPTVLSLRSYGTVQNLFLNGLLQKYESLMISSSRTRQLAVRAGY